MSSEVSSYGTYATYLNPLVVDADGDGGVGLWDQDAGAVPLPIVPCPDLKPTSPNWRKPGRDEQGRGRRGRSATRRARGPSVRTPDERHPRQASPCPPLILSVILVVEIVSVMALRSRARPRVAPVGHAGPRLYADRGGDGDPGAPRLTESEPRIRYSVTPPLAGSSEPVALRRRARSQAPRPRLALPISRIYSCNEAVWDVWPGNQRPAFASHLGDVARDGRIVEPVRRLDLAATRGLAQHERG